MVFQKRPLEILTERDSPLENIVVSGVSAVAHTRHSLFSPSLRSLPLAPRAVALAARNGTAPLTNSNVSLHDKQKTTLLGAFEHSRERFPTRKYSRLGRVRGGAHPTLLIFSQLALPPPRTASGRARCPERNRSSYEFQSFAFGINKKDTFWCPFCLWRRERDSNSRNGISVHTISNRAP